jgi:hypothetical protein
MTPIQRLRDEGTIFKESPDELFAHWGAHEISVQRELVDTNPHMIGWWYITVRCPDGGLAYDGWWRDSDDKSLADAVAEAFKGARLLVDA